MKNVEAPAERKPSGMMMKYGMWACCAIMLAPIVLYFAAGGMTDGLVSTAFILAPLAVCMGAHFVMHRFREKSCHGDAEHGGPEVTKDQTTIGRPIASE